MGSLTFEAPDEAAFPLPAAAREAAVAGGTAPCVLNAANEVAVHAFLRDRLSFLGIAEVIEGALDQPWRGARHSFQTLYAADAEARAVVGELVEARAAGGPDELGAGLPGLRGADHPARGGPLPGAKAVGMRVEKFSLFFGPMLAKFRRGETTYGIAAIPLGGYVKITGMNPHEEIPEDVAHRAYFRQPVWKRIVVILAGPTVNLVLAFLLLAGIFFFNGYAEPSTRLGAIERELSRGRGPEGRRRAGRGRRRARRAGGARPPDRHAHVRRAAADRRLQGLRARPRHRRPRRPAAELLADADLRRRRRPAADPARVRLRTRSSVTPAS